MYYLGSIFAHKGGEVGNIIGHFEVKKLSLLHNMQNST